MSEEEAIVKELKEIRGTLKGPSWLQRNLMWFGAGIAITATVKAIAEKLRPQTEGEDEDEGEEPQDD